MPSQIRPPLAQPSAPTGKSLTHIAAQRHADLAALLAQPPAHLQNPDLVHDLRVASRRLREVARILTSVPGFLPKSAARSLSDTLKALRRSMGDLRDADVTREHLLTWRMPAPIKRTARQVADELAKTRPTLQAAAQHQMTSTPLAAAMLLLARLLEDHSTPDRLEKTDHLLRTALSAHLQKREKQLRRSFGQAAKKQSPDAFHAARIAAKKLRYTLELAADADLLPHAKSKIASLKSIQQLLGTHHDTHVILHRLSHHIPTPAWQKWQKQIHTTQAHRAADFFVKSYTWMNS